MEDENADRVYVPGTNGTPPDRDVEPFWPSEELKAPVHGGQPVPRDAPPAFPLPPAPPVTPPVAPPQLGDPGVYRPTDRPVVPPPQQPVYHQQTPPPAPRTPASGQDAAQPWPNIPPRTGPAAAPVSGAPDTSDEPTAGDPAPDATTQARPGDPAAVVVSASSGDAPGSSAPASTAPADDESPAAPDSPWAQPPQRPTPAPGPQPAGPTPRVGASAPVPSTYYPAVTPRQSPENVDAQDSGAVYRAGPVGPENAPGNGPQPAIPQQPGPHQASPTPPSPQQPSPQQPSQQPWPVEQPPPWAGNGQQDPAAPMPGPYPPTVDPRAVPPHPHLQQPRSGEQPAPGPAPQPPPPVDPYQQLPWVSDGTPTAEEFARRRLAKPAEPTATMGARAMLQKGTMGLVRLAPGKREQEYKQDVEMVRRNFGGLRQVTVVNPKGGAGKTVAVLLLAMTFGQKRGGYVLAWDNNETQGTLGMRAQQDFHARTVRDMMRDLHLFRGSHGRVGDLSQYVRAQGEGMFDVLASDESATAGEMLTASAFAEIREIVSRFYKLIFVDTGNNVRAQNWQAAMDATDQLVITMSARNDSAETAARMLDHLEQSGRQRLVRQAVSVVTMPPTRKDIDLPAIQRHFAARTRAVLLAPYEKLIDSGEPLRYGHLSAGTRDSWLKIAAAVAEGL